MYLSSGIILTAESINDVLVLTIASRALASGALATAASNLARIASSAFLPSKERTKFIPHDWQHFDQHQKQY